MSEPWKKYQEKEEKKPWEKYQATPVATPQEAAQPKVFDLNEDGDAQFADWQAQQAQKQPAVEPSSDKALLDQIGGYASTAGDWISNEARDIGSFAEGMMSDPDARSRAVEVGQGALREAASGITFGGYDEMKGMEQGFYAKLRGEDYDEAYDKEKKRVEDLQAQYQEEFPGASTAANVAGGMLLPLPKGGGAMKNMAVDASTGFSSGYLSAEEGDRIMGGLEGAATGLGLGRAMATMGSVGSGIIGHGKRIAQDLGDKIEEFIPIHLAGDKSNPLLRNFYQKIVAPSTGGDELIEQQARVIAREEENLARSMQSGKESVARQKAEVDAIKRASVEELEGQSGQAVARQQTQYRSDIAKQSMPPGSTAKESEAIQAAMLQDPQTGMGMLKHQWTEKGFQNIKTREFEISEEALLKEIFDDLPVHMQDIYPRASQMIKSSIGKKAKAPPRGLEFNADGNPILVRGEGADKISGEALMNARNELRFMVNALGDDGEAALQKAGYAKAANKIDDIIKRQLPKNMRAAYEDELTKWGVFLTARDATGKAGVRKQGMFDADDILTAEKSNVGARFSEGRSPLYKSAQAQQRAAAQEGKALKRAVEKRKDEFKVAREDVKTPAAIQKEINNFDEKVKTYKRKAAAESKSPYQAAFANVILTSPIHAVATGLGGPGGLFASGVTTPITATAIGKWFARPSVQRYFAGQTGMQKSIKASIDKMEPKAREALFSAMPVAIRNEYIMNEKDDDIEAAQQAVGRLR